MQSQQRTRYELSSSKYKEGKDKKCKSDNVQGDLTHRMQARQDQKVKHITSLMRTYRNSRLIIKLERNFCQMRHLLLNPPKCKSCQAPNVHFNQKKKEKRKEKRAPNVHYMRVAQARMVQWISRYSNKGSSQKLVYLSSHGADRGRDKKKQQVKRTRKMLL